MKKVELQQILIMIDTVETQVKALRQMVGLSLVAMEPSDEHQLLSPKRERAGSYTTASEDEEIDLALKIEDERDEIFQDLVLKARSQGTLTDGDFIE